jgi:protein LTV1
MGKFKKPFIAKEKAQKFVLVHRSLTDAARAGEEQPSEYVLVPSNDLAANSMREQELSREGGTKGGTKGEAKGGGGKRVTFQRGPPSEVAGNHVNEFGFKNDGYDYTQHLKEMGSGTFVGKDGSISLLKRPDPIKLPPEALPSDLKALERDLKAITISHEFMDSDLRDALFCDEEGLFEELDDNFVVEALQEPEKPDFDFDSHIAKLIERSERSLQTSQDPRGWDDENENEDEDDEEIESLSDLELDGETTNASSYAGGFLDDAFEKTLAEYDDDELGDAPYADEEDMQGQIDDTLDDSNRNELFEAALNEYLEEEKDGKLVTGVLVKKGNKVVPLQKISDEEFERAFEKDGISADEKYRILAKQAEALNNSFAEVAAGMNFNDDDELLTCQEYLRETRVEEKWDCETILITYSTLENHPTIIKDEWRNPRKGSGSGGTKTSSISSSNEEAKKPSRIVLSGKFNMPITYVSGYKAKPASVGASMKECSSISTDKKVLSRRKVKVETEEENDSSLNEPDAAEDKSSSDSSNGSDDDECWEVKPELRKETPEERRVRKALVKLERRQKRASKKNLKVAYNAQSTDLNQATKRGLNNMTGISVFKYSV